MEDRIADIQAVMDAVGLDQAVLLGSSEGAAACAYFAALYPKRVSALIFYSPAVVALADDECPWAWNDPRWAGFFEALEDAWATGAGSRPSIRASPTTRTRGLGTPATSGSQPVPLVRTLMRHNLESDVRGVLPTIRRSNPRVAPG